MATASTKGETTALHRVCIRPAPRREPPFEDELPVQLGAGRHDQRLPFAVVQVPRPWRLAPPRLSSLPEPAAWGRRMLIGLVETAGGHRALQQLAPLLSPSVARGLQGDLVPGSSPRAHWLRSATVLSVRAFEPADGVAEVCATLGTGWRVRAVALRLESVRGSWQCTRLQLG